MRKFVATASVCALATLGAAHATIVSGSVTGGSAMTAGGTFVELNLPFTPPNGTENTVGQDTFQTPNLYGFDENQNIVATNTIEVNIGTDVQVGEIVASHYIFFDPGPSQDIQGCVSFDSPVYGIITSRALLNASDNLQNNSVNYLSPSLRGLESGDSAWIGNDGMSICVDFTASSPGDFIRVLTMESPGGYAVPLPAAVWMFLAGLTGLGATRRMGRKA